MIEDVKIYWLYIEDEEGFLFGLLSDGRVERGENYTSERMQKAYEHTFGQGLNNNGWVA